MTNPVRTALWGAVLACLPAFACADDTILPSPSLVVQTGPLVGGEVTPPPRRGAIHHAMPPGGYVGTVALTALLPPPQRGAVQHAMPPGGYVGSVSGLVVFATD